MLQFNRYNLLLELCDLAEQAGPVHADLTNYIMESFLPEAGNNLQGALEQLMKKTGDAAQRAGGHVVDNLKAMFKQAAQTYAAATADRETPKGLAKSCRTEAGMVAAVSILMLGSAVANSGYGKDQAVKLVQQAAEQFSHANSLPWERGSTGPVDPKAPRPPRTRRGPREEDAKPEDAQMESIQPISEGSLDLMFLPGDVVAWLYDRPEDQMKTAKEIGVAAAEVGNPIGSGAALRSDHNVLLLKPTHGGGRFHVYPDGSMSFNGELVDGHEDVEKLIGIKPEEHEVDPNGSAEMVDNGGMEDFAEPTMIAHEEPEEDLSGMDDGHPMDDIHQMDEPPHQAEHDQVDHLLVSHGLGGLMRIEGLDLNDLLDEEHIGFKKLKNKLAHEKGVKNPGALSAYIGDKKYGKKGMEKKAHAAESTELDEAGVTDKFKKIKQKVSKINPKAKTPKLDHAIKMWSKIEEGAIGDRLEWSNLRGDTFAGKIVRLEEGVAHLEDQHGNAHRLSIGLTEDVLEEANATLTFLKNVRHDLANNGKSTIKLDKTIAAIEAINI